MLLLKRLHPTRGRPCFSSELSCCRAQNTVRHAASNSTDSWTAVNLPSAAAWGMGLCAIASQAIAFGPVSVSLSSLEPKQVACPDGVFSVTGVSFSGQSSRAVCLRVTATADNPSQQPLYNADVFGRVYDALGEPALDAIENIRVAYIDEIQPGTSSVSFQLIVPDEQYKLGPLQLQKFKATGFPGKNLPGQGSGLIDVADCEIEGDCPDPEESLIR